MRTKELTNKIEYGFSELAPDMFDAIMQRIEQEDQTKQLLVEEPVQKKNIFEVLSKRILPVSAGIVMACMMFLLIFPWKTNEIAVIMKINPSIQITMNESYEVIKLQGLNQDGKDVVNALNWKKNQPIETVMEALFVDLTEKSYLKKDGEIQLTVSSVKNDKYTEVETKLEKEIEKNLTSLGYTEVSTTCKPKENEKSTETKADEVETEVESTETTIEKDTEVTQTAPEVQTDTKDPEKKESQKPKKEDTVKSEQENKESQKEEQTESTEKKQPSVKEESDQESNIDEKPQGSGTETLKENPPVKDKESTEDTDENMNENSTSKNEKNESVNPHNSNRGPETGKSNVDKWENKNENSHEKDWGGEKGKLPGDNSENKNEDFHDSNWDKWNQKLQDNDWNIRNRKK